MARVLVVEDSPDQARLIASLLQAAGLDAEVVSSGEAALEAMAHRTPDVVATDLIMPGLNGLEVVEEVKKRHPLVPVILMTAFGNGEIAARALQKGAASYVPKRRVHDELVPTIEDTLSVARGRREEKRMLGFLESAAYTFDLENDPSLIPPLVNYVQDSVRARSADMDETGLMQLGIALHEALINAMHHGNLEVGSELREAGGEVYRELIQKRLRRDPYRDRRVHVSLTLTRHKLECLIRDEGPGFDPREVPDPTDPRNLERVSGRGLYLIWTFMDDVTHNDSGNEIRLVKRLPASTVAG